MKVTYNGKIVTVTEVSNKIKSKIETMSSELFRKYVDAFVKNLPKTRENARKIVKHFLRTHSGHIVNGSELPNMNSGLIHGNSMKYNMLENIVYDRANIKVRVGKTKAKITIPYGIDTDGADNLVKNKKGVTYAQILDKWNGISKRRNVPSIKRFNGFIDSIKTYYKGTLKAEVERDIYNKFNNQVHL